MNNNIFDLIPLPVLQIILEFCNNQVYFRNIYSRTRRLILKKFKFYPNSKIAKKIDFSILNTITNLKLMMSINIHGEIVEHRQNLYQSMNNLINNLDKLSELKK